MGRLGNKTVWVAALATLALAGCANMSLPPMLGGGSAPSTLVAPMSAAMLVGATPAVLNAQFGAPALLRVDGTAQVWLYHSPVCGLDLILYPDSSGMPRVADAVPDNGDASRCVASFHRSLTDAALERSPAS